ncbi:MAG: Hpt domain-containing protein [Bacteroidales bacterium]|nr:Hpt domain-containing protein [Bacteroidales bacterium]
METKLYNLSYLAELSGGDMEFEKSMIDYFISNTPAVIQTIDSLLEQENWKQIREEIHRFIPNLNMVGASSLLADSNSIEKYTETAQNLDLVHDLWTGVKMQCFKLVEQLKVDL